MLSRKLAEYYPRLCYEVFQDVIFRLEMVDELNRGQALSYLVPWIRKMDLNDHSIDISQVVDVKFL